MRNGQINDADDLNWDYKNKLVLVCECMSDYAPIPDHSQTQLTSYQEFTTGPCSTSKCKRYSLCH